MRNKIWYAILALSFGIGSCKKSFIAINPETQLNTNSFFKTDDDFQQALIGVYQALQAYPSPSGWLMGESRSDNARYDPNPLSRAIIITDKENVSDFLDNASNNQTKPKYTNNYIGISRANTILDHLADANISESVKKSVNGEAKFLRAFFYFDLVQFYGGVPLNLHEVVEPDQAFLPRSSVDSVYNTIIADLKDAIQSMPQSVSFPQSGRATIGAAKMLLANVYIVRKKYAEAEVLLKDVTQMGYTLLPDYGSVYALNNKNSKESIFEIQYKEGSADGQYSAFIYFFIPQMNNSTVITGINTSTLSSGFNVPTQDLIDSYEAGDKRLDASVAVAEGNYDASGAFVASSVQSIIGYTTPPGKVSKLFIKKYLHPPYATPGQTGDNWPVYRYSEALLSLAECLNEAGKSAEALSYLNQVRVRAGLAPSIEENQNTLRDIIFQERRIELAFENKRWLDLVRTGKAISVMTAFGNKVKSQDSRIPASAYNVTNDRLLFPFPLTEVQVNPQIIQNPGYN